MKVRAIWDCIIKEKSVEKDLGGFNKIILGEGEEEITISVDSGMIVIYAAGGSRLIVYPANHASIRVEGKRI